MLFEERGSWWAHSFLTTVPTFRGWLLFCLRVKEARLGYLFSTTWFSNDRLLRIKYQKAGDSDSILTIGCVSYSMQFIVKPMLYSPDKTLVFSPSHRVLYLLANIKQRCPVENRFGESREAGQFPTLQKYRSEKQKCLFSMQSGTESDWL